MGKLKKVVVLTLVLVTAGYAVSQKPKELDNVFYCFNNAVRSMPNTPESYEARAALIKKIGFDGLAGHREETFEKWHKAMQAINLPMPEMYIGMTINKEGKPAHHPSLKGILQQCAGTDLLVTLHLHNNSSMKDSEKADQVLVEGIQQLADFCHPLGIKIAIYPHVNFYCETVGHAVELAEAINRRNVGVVFNMCHFWKVEGSQGWKDAIQLARPYLFMISINGIDAGDSKAMGWDKLIQPLGQGSFDTYELVKYAKDLGFEGYFGLQCYNIKQDCEKALTQSMKTWKSYQERYRQENQ